LYDSSLHPLVTAEGNCNNDDVRCSSLTQSLLARTLSSGTYYLAVGGFNLCSDQTSPGDDDYVVGDLMPFPDSLACSNPVVGQNRTFSITDGWNSALQPCTTTKPFEVLWFQFTVVDGPVGSTSCDPGANGVLACPCSNPPSGPGRGCDNSFVTGGASITANGVASLQADTVVLTTSNQTPNGTSIVLQGTSTISAGLAFGMGVRCVGGTLKRLYVETGSGGGITVPKGSWSGVSARSASLGDTISSGTYRHYLVYYRDPVLLNGCGLPNTFNSTNSLSILWNP